MMSTVLLVGLSKLAIIGIVASVHIMHRRNYSYDPILKYFESDKNQKTLRLKFRNKTINLLKNSREFVKKDTIHKIKISCK